MLSIRQISRDLLVLGLGYRLQEIDQGGLGRATRRKLQTIAKSLRKTGRVGSTPSLSLKPAARLVREWRGRTHTVTVTEDGFEYAVGEAVKLTGAPISDRSTRLPLNTPFSLIAATAALSWPFQVGRLDVFLLPWMFGLLLRWVSPQRPRNQAA